jgi:hypothetical protein
MKLFVKRPQKKGIEIGYLLEYAHGFWGRCVIVAEGK